MAPRPRIAYFSAFLGGQSEEAQRAEQDAKSLCESRRWALVDLWRGHLAAPPHERILPQERILTGLTAREFSGVILPRPEHAFDGLSDFAQFLVKAQRIGWTFVSFSPLLDTATSTGQSEIERWIQIAEWDARAAERERRVRAKTPGRKPAIVGETAELITNLRARGVTLQGICDVLNDRDVPTPRGGAVWRPSSLQSFVEGAFSISEEQTILSHVRKRASATRKVIRARR